MGRGITSGALELRKRTLTGVMIKDESGRSMTGATRGKRTTRSHGNPRQKTSLFRKNMEL